MQLTPQVTGAIIALSYVASHLAVTAIVALETVGRPDEKAKVKASHITIAALPISLLVAACVLVLVSSCHREREESPNERTQVRHPEPRS